jgi:hypothetical protein
MNWLHLNVIHNWPVAWLVDYSHSSCLRATSEYPDQYIDPKNYSSARFTLLIKDVVNQFPFSVHSNVPGQYIANIQAILAALNCTTFQFDRVREKAQLIGSQMGYPVGI